MLKQGLYIAENNDSIWDAYTIKMQFKETKNSYIFELVDLRSRYSAAHIETLFQKSKKFVLQKDKGGHAMRIWGNIDFTIYPYQAGIILFQICGSPMPKQKGLFMKYQLLCVPENEQSYLYAPVDSDPHEKMRIGHLRGDFGCDGDEFWHTWFPCHEELNTQEFKQELGNVVDDLRENTEHPLLKDRRSMASVCGRFPDNCMLNQWHSEWYCFKIVTERYMYYIRCFTDRGDYNFYIYCYVNDNPAAQQQDSGKTKERDYICYHVGQVYDRKMDKDGAVFDLIGKMGYINIGFTDMTDEETAVLERGKLEIYLSVIHGLVFITAMFDNKLIMDMPFHAGLYNGFNIEDPKRHGYLAPIIAVDNRDNVIKVLRVTSLDPTFSAVLYALALEQSNGRPLNYDEHLQMIYDRYSQTDIIRKAILKNNGEATA